MVSTRSQSKNCPGSDRFDARALFLRANIPLRHARTIVDDSASPEAWKRARDKVLHDIGSGFIIALVGRRGTGKTQIAQQVALASCGLDRSALYCRGLDYFLDLRATYSAEGQCERDVIERYQTPRLLIVDEVQERGESEWEDRMLTHLLDKRYGDMTDTILIANLKPDAFRDNVGASVADRLIETGGIIECDWESFRTKKEKHADG